MRHIFKITFVLFVGTVAFGISPMSARATEGPHHNDKKKAEEAAKHEAEKARKAREEAEKRAEHERKLQKEHAEHERKAQQETAKKVEHEKQKQLAQKTQLNGPLKQEHEKSQKASSEARIAASRKARAAKPAQKSRQLAEDRPIAASLSKVALSLHHADHDYDWQRHEAVEQVKGALHELHEPEPNTGGKFGDMTQKHSDQILRENIPILESVRSQLSAPKAPAHHQRAKEKIEEALSNLQAALKIR